MTQESQVVYLMVSRPKNQSHSGDERLEGVWYSKADAHKYVAATNPQLVRTQFYVYPDALRLYLPKEFEIVRKIKP